MFQLGIEKMNYKTKHMLRFILLNSLSEKNYKISNCFMKMNNW